MIGTRGEALAGCQWHTAFWSIRNGCFSKPSARCQTRPSLMCLRHPDSRAIRATGVPHTGTSGENRSACRSNGSNECNASWAFAHRFENRCHPAGFSTDWGKFSIGTAPCSFAPTRFNRAFGMLPCKLGNGGFRYFRIRHI